MNSRKLYHWIYCDIHNVLTHLPNVLDILYYILYFTELKCTSGDVETLNYLLCSIFSRYTNSCYPESYNSRNLLIINLLFSNLSTVNDSYPSGSSFEVRDTCSLATMNLITHCFSLQSHISSKT